jgi:Ca-activated chloride channel family protein
VEIEGFSVATVLDEAILQEIAGLTNGTYFYAEDEADLEEIYDSIDLQLTIRGEKMEVTSIIAGIGLLLFLAGGGLSMMWFGRVP